MKFAGDLRKIARTAASKITALSSLPNTTGRNSRADVDGPNSKLFCPKEEMTASESKWAMYFASVKRSYHLDCGLRNLN